MFATVHFPRGSVTRGKQDHGVFFFESACKKKIEADLTELPDGPLQHRPGGVFNSAIFFPVCVLLGVII